MASLLAQMLAAQRSGQAPRLPYAMQIRRGQQNLPYAMQIRQPRNRLAAANREVAGIQIPHYDRSVMRGRIMGSIPRF